MSYYNWVWALGPWLLKLEQIRRRSLRPMRLRELVHPECSFAAATPPFAGATPLLCGRAPLPFHIFAQKCKKSACHAISEKIVRNQARERVTKSPRK